MHGEVEQREEYRDGRLYALQAVELEADAALFGAWAEPARLAWLWRRYFELAEREAGGLFGVDWAQGAPTVWSHWPRLALLVMSAPRVERGPGRAASCMTVEGGLIVAPCPEPRPRFSLELTQLDAGRARAALVLRDYPPRWGGRAPVRWLYLHTEARMHVRVGVEFLRRLARHWDAPPPIRTAGR